MTSENKDTKTMIAIPVSLPEQDPLKEKQKGMITLFVKEFLGPSNRPAQYRDEKEERLEFIAYKYLTARKWKYKDAAEMFTSTVAWRTCMGFDNQSLFPPAISVRGYPLDKLAAMFNPGGVPRDTNRQEDKIVRQLRGYYFVGFHKWDKQGHPVLIELTGRADPKMACERLRKVTKPGDPFAHSAEPMHLHQNEIGGCLVKYQDETFYSDQSADRRPITTATIIMDLAGLSFSHLIGDLVDIVKATAHVDQSHYPEGMHRLLAVNAPTMVMAAYTLVKGVLDKRVQNKIVFVPPEKTRETLLRVIDEEHLPSFLGGTCNCEGGCIPMDPESDLCQHDVLTEEVSVPSGETYQRDIQLSRDEQAYWRFHTSEKFLVTATFTPKNGHKESISETKDHQGEVTYKATDDGVVTIVWHNKFSWIMSKTLLLYIARIDASGREHKV